MTSIKFARVRLLPGIILGALLPFAAHADIDSPTKLISLIEKTQNLLFAVLVTLAGVFIVIAGYLFLGSGGDEKRVSAAKKQLIYAVIAVVVATLSRVIIDLTYRFVQ